MKVDILKSSNNNNRSREFIILQHDNALRDSSIFQDCILFKSGIDLNEGEQYLGIISIDECIHDIMFQGYHSISFDLLENN